LPSFTYEHPPLVSLSQPSLIFPVISGAQPKYGKLPPQTPSHGDRCSQFAPKYPSGHSQVASVSLRATQIPFPQSISISTQGLRSQCSPNQASSHMHAFSITGNVPPRYRAEQNPWSLHNELPHKSISQFNPVYPGLHSQDSEPQSQYEFESQTPVHISGQLVGSIIPAKLS